MASLSYAKLSTRHQPRIQVRVRSSRRTTQLAPRAFQAHEDVGTYLSKAAEQIFHPMNESDVPWGRSSEPFSGGIAHHEDVDRVRVLYESVKKTRKDIEGCTDANAANYDPSATAEDGSCTYQFTETGELKTIDGSLHQFVTSAIERVFNNNFKGDKNEPAAYFSTGYSTSGRRSSRDLQKDVDRLRRFETVLKQAIDASENK